MTSFERSTVRLAWLTFFVGLVAAGFVGLQWHEMHTGGEDTKTLAEEAKRQTAALSQQMSATAALAIAAKNQADASKTIAEKAISQSAATNRLASEAKRSADLAQSQQTPWLGIEQPDSIPVRFDYSWAAILPYSTINVDVRFSAKNYGPSPAHLIRSKL